MSRGGQVNSSNGYCINGANCITSWPSAGGGGTVTAIMAGTGLSGGTITTSGTISLNVGNANTWTGAQTFSANTSFPGGIWNSSGRLGIGTSAPAYKLDVAGQIRSTSGGFIFPDGSVQTTAAATASQVWSSGSSGAVYYSGGNVGIGTTSPAYLLSVNGTIGAKEVFITASGWSDYVFDPAYRLQPLADVAAYIQANHHLPDIPSEAEVKENGISVSEMQSKLLAKIEELTLHLIRVEEKNNGLEEEVRNLRQSMPATSEGLVNGHVHQ